MRTVLALDLSLHTGYAFLRDLGEGNHQVLSYGTIELGQARDSKGKLRDVGAQDFGDYPHSYVRLAEAMAEKIMSTLRESGLAPDEVVIEETTGSNNNYSQKILEFLHYLVLKRLWAANVKKVYYVRTGVWRKMSGATQNEEERKFNARVSRIKRKSGTRVAKIDGKVVGRKNRKSYAIRAAREIFGLEFRMKDNNTVDALLLGHAFIRNAALCDGTVHGGTGGPDGTARQG